MKKKLYQKEIAIDFYENRYKKGYRTNSLLKKTMCF